MHYCNSNKSYKYINEIRYIKSKYKNVEIEFKEELSNIN